MEGTMKVCVLTGQRQLEWTEREIPQPAQGELQIKLEYVGICGSDLHFYDQGRLANWELDGPLALGHEPGGVVTAIGEGVRGFSVGDKVAIEPAVPCGKCEACRTGHYNLCPDVKMLAIPHERDGVFAEYCTHDATMCYKLPDNMDTMEGGLLEPLTVGMHGTELSDAKIGETAIVLGCGCIGLCTIMSLKARGVTEIYAADVLDKRLEMALEVGATRVFNSKKESIEEFAKTLPGGGADQVYECAGNRITTLQTCRLIKRAGKVTLVGVSPEPVLELDIATLNAMEGTIYSVYRYRNLYPKAIKAVSGGLIPLKKIVSHVFDFKDCIHAIEYSNDHKDEVKHIVKEDSKSFKKKLLIHIPDENFRSVRYYGFYSNKAGEELDHVHELLGDKKSRDYSKETRKKKRC